MFSAGEVNVEQFGDRQISTSTSANSLCQEFTSCKDHFTLSGIKYRHSINEGLQFSNKININKTDFCLVLYIVWRPILILALLIIILAGEGHVTLAPPPTSLPLVPALPSFGGRLVKVFCHD